MFYRLNIFSDDLGTFTLLVFAGSVIFVSLIIAFGGVILSLIDRHNLLFVGEGLAGVLGGIAIWAGALTYERKFKHRQA